MFTLLIFFLFTPLCFLFKFPEFSEEQSIEKKYPGVLSAILVDFMKVINGIPARMIHCPNSGLMLGQRPRRWSNIEPALG